MLQAGVQLLDSISVSTTVAVKWDLLIYPWGSADRDFTINKLFKCPVKYESSC